MIFKLSRKAKPTLNYEALIKKLQGIPEHLIDIRKIRETVLEIRASKLPDPKIIGNAGSFFKNPVVDQAKMEELKERFPGVVYFESRD